ncbi:LysM peptidoglycan-binding domain-containing protein [Olleya namhaensis]|uniref:LysM peptidoglycan-binding domain-containing protein n=1 Tax=Olleya namhaensis TaxID=1144750 RepID=UPI00232D3741|nr:LysM peptidoglycan-binding domain-containing protein [Olleya namhaensis]
MKNILFILVFLFANLGIAQEVEEEFLPIVIEEKEAFMSTLTGEYVFREHAKTDPEQLQTTPSGVVYNDISTHVVKKGETLSVIAEKYKLGLTQLKKDNNLKSNALSLGQKLKIINKVLVTSSSPVISYSGDDRIIAKLRPGQSPSTLAPPPSQTSQTMESDTKITKTVNPKDKKTKVKGSIYSKPMIIPTVSEPSNTTVPVTTIEEEVVAAPKVEVQETVITNQITVLEASEEVRRAERQLEDAKQRLKLAKKAQQSKVTAPVKIPAVAEQNEIVETVVNETVIEDTAVEDAVVAKDVVKQIVESEETVVVEEVVVEEAIEETVEDVLEEETEVATEDIADKTDEGKEESEEEAKEEVEGVDYHIIVEGDNLYNLALKHKTTVKKLTLLNNVKFNNLKIGQKLKLK